MKQPQRRLRKMLENLEDSNPSAQNKAFAFSNVKLMNDQDGTTTTAVACCC